MKKQHKDKLLEPFRLASDIGISSYKLSQLTGIPQSSLSRYKNGQAVPSVEAWFKIVEAVGYSAHIFPKKREFK